jgi:hypothetical protein
MANKKRPDMDLLKQVNSVFEECGSQIETARRLGIPRTTIQDYLRYYVEAYDNPLSEDGGRYQESWTAQDCIDELRRIAEIDPEKIITRNYFRNHSKISESTWTQFFGTFQEFKSQAGLVLSRSAKQLERQIAKHASIDIYREVNSERHSFSENYVKPNSGRYKTVLVCSDLHDTECDEFFLEVLIDTAKRLQPDVLVFNGDIFDLPEFGRYSVDPREWDVVGRIKFVHEEIFTPLREACPDTQFDFIEGNHEFRLLKHLTDATPALKVVLSDLHGFTIPKLLGLDEFEINYIAKADMSAYMKTDVKKEIGKNYKVYFDSFICHHFPEGKQLGMPGINGHHHKGKLDTLYNETFGSYQWLQIPAGHRSEATYCMGEKWGKGFAIAHVDTQECRTIFELATVGATFAIVGGKYYFR